MAAGANCADLRKTGDSLFSKKKQWDSLCQEIAENCYPMRASFTSSLSLGNDFSEDIMDSSMVQARETLGNVPQAVLRQGNWYSVATGVDDIDNDPECAAWMETQTKVFRKAIDNPKARFNRATEAADHDWVAFGMPVLSVEESSDRRNYAFNAWHPASIAFMENADHRIDHIQRKMPMTARAIKQKWGKTGTINQAILTAAANSPSTEFQIRHVVMPTEEYYGDDRKMMRKYAGRPFLSIYMDCDHDQIIFEGALPSFRYVVPRWRMVPPFTLGFSPVAINSLPDGRMLNSLAEMMLEQGEKALDPAVMAKGDIFRDAVNAYAGGLTYVDMENDQKIQDIISTWPTGDFNIGVEMKQDTRNLIASAWLLNKISLPPQQKTAYETSQLIEEYRRAVLPFFGPINSEYHLPLLDEAFQVGIHNRMFDFQSAPLMLKQYLQDADGTATGEFTFTFDNPLATAEGRLDVQAFNESVQIIAAGGNFDKTIPGMIDWKKATTGAVKGTGAPAVWFTNEKTQQANEEQQAQVDQANQAATVLQKGSQVGLDVAQASQAMQQAGLNAPAGV